MVNLAETELGGGGVGRGITTLSGDRFRRRSDGLHPPPPAPSGTRLLVREANAELVFVVSIPF